MRKSETTERRRSERPPIRAGWVLLPLLALAASGCGDTGSEPESRVTLSISTTASGQRAPASRLATGDGDGEASRGVEAPPRRSAGVSGAVTSQDTAGNTVTVESVFLVVGSIEVRPGGADSCGSDGACVRVADQALLLPIPLDNSVHTVNPAGRLEPVAYEGMRLQLRTAEESDGAVVDSFPQLEGASMLLEGTYNDSSFALAAGSDSPVVLDLSPPLDLSGGPASANVTIMAESRSWFFSDEGVLMDPASPGAGEQVADNVVESLSAFPDRDADGSPDGAGPVGG